MSTVSMSFSGGHAVDEELSRANERIVSVRTFGHRWDPKRQRPELWNLYKTRTNPGETLRVFPLSNWTELDAWQYIARECIEVVPLSFEALRPVVRRNGTRIMRDDDRMQLAAGESPEMRVVRFRTVGCYPLTGAIESQAANIDDIRTRSSMSARRRSLPRQADKIQRRSGL